MTECADCGKVLRHVDGICFDCGKRRLEEDNIRKVVMDDVKQLIDEAIKGHVGMYHSDPGDISRCTECGKLLLGLFYAPQKDAVLCTTCYWAEADINHQEDD